MPVTTSEHAHLSDSVPVTNPRTLRAISVCLGLIAVVLVVAAVWLAFANPTIDGTSHGDNYQCLAPYDTVLLRADNYPGGGPWRDSPQTAARCREAGREQFQKAALFLLGAVVAGAGAVVAETVRHRNRRRLATPLGTGV